MSLYLVAFVRLLCEPLSAVLVFALMSDVWAFVSATDALLVSIFTKLDASEASRFYAMVYSCS